MATIFYGMCGQGLGHVSRAMTIAEHMPHHDFYIFTYGSGINYTNNTKLPNIKEVFEIDGVKFHEPNGQISDMGTMLNVWEFLSRGLYKSKKFVLEKCIELKPSVILTDWEPICPRAASILDIPCVSIDSQHKFRFSGPPNMSFPFHVYSSFVSVLTRFMVPKANHYILSTYQSDVIPARPNVTPAQCFIKKAVEENKTDNDGSALVYSGYPHITNKLINCLLQSGFNGKVISYGPDLSSQYPEVTFKQSGGPDFINDLCKCRAVFSTAGVQLIGEARFLGKPSFVVPLPKQYEQTINGAYINILGLGTSCKFTKVTPARIKTFLEVYSKGIPKSVNGVYDAIQVIESYIK